MAVLVRIFYYIFIFSMASCSIIQGTRHSTGRSLSSVSTGQGVDKSCIKLMVDILDEISMPSRPFKVVREGVLNSQPGKLIRDSNNNLWLLKGDTVHPELQTGAEIISSELYSLLGHKTPKMKVVDFEGERFVAVEWLGDGLKLDRFHNDNHTSEFKQLLVFAAWLKDWDRLRGKHIFIEDGHIGMIDFGGTLGARAEGQLKQGDIFSDQIGTFEKNITGEEILKSFQVDWIRPNHAWRQLDEIDYLEAAKKLKNITDKQIERIVRKAKYSNIEDYWEMKESLIKRRDALIDHIENLYKVQSSSPLPIKHSTPEREILKNKEKIKAEKNEIKSKKSLQVKFPKKKEGLAEKLKSEENIKQYLRGEKLMAQSPEAELLSNRIMNEQLDLFDLTDDEYIAIKAYLDENSRRRRSNNEAYGLWLRGKLKKSKNYSVDHDGYTSDYYNGYSIPYDIFKSWETVFAKSPPVPPHLKLYRGAVLEKGRTLPKVGDKVSLRGILSTSVDIDIAKEFMNPRSEKYTYEDGAIRVLKIYKTSSKTKAIFMPSVGWKYNQAALKNGNTPISPNILREEEYGIHPLSTFTVTNVKLKKDDLGAYYEITHKAN